MAEWTRENFSGCKNKRWLAEITIFSSSSTLQGVEGERKKSFAILAYAI